MDNQQTKIYYKVHLDSLGYTEGLDISRSVTRLCHLIRERIQEAYPQTDVECVVRPCGLQDVEVYCEDFTCEDSITEHVRWLAEKVFNSGEWVVEEGNHRG